MLPLKLTLENFMPYRGRQEPLILEGLGIACLSGPNGAGKSSLLDAITWALWGRSRAGSSADQLVAAQMSDMGVQLEFRSHGVDYRVERRHRRRRSGGQTTFDFQMRDGDGWRSGNGVNARETGKKLVDTIRLDYETFINSAFLVQGKADLFVSQRPAERKRILGEILNLSEYERYAQTARDMARDDRNRRDVASGRIEAIDRELEQEAGLRSEAEEIAEILVELRQGLESAIKRRDELNTVVADMRERQRDLSAVQARLTELSAEVDGLTARRDELQEAVESAVAILARGEEIEAGWGELEAARSALTDLGSRAGKHGELVAEQSRLEQEATARRSQLENDVSLKERAHADLAEQAGRLTTLQESLTAASAQRAGLTEREHGLAERRAERDDMNGQLGEMRATLAAFKKEGDELEPRMAVIAADFDAECPVCGTQLGQHGMERVRAHFQQRKGEITAQAQQITSDGMALRSQFDALVKEIEQNEAALREESSRMDSEAGSIRTQLERAQDAAARLTEAATALEKARTARAALPQESDELRIMRARIAEIGYDSMAHTAAQERETALRHWESERRDLDTVSARVDRDKSALVDVTERLERAAESLETQNVRASGLEAGLEGMDEAVAEAEEAAATVESLSSEIQDAGEDKVRIDTRLQQLGERRDEKARLRDEERQAASRASVHDELALAFGPRGVQALLIETALPELEDDANDLLGRMTNNEMTLRLETQRTTQAGNTVETLEVIIADILNTRAYEMYSGGEAFRINFALRIALSKLLARRAGSEVPVLFIDEGFGSQDEEGRERLIEAISALWNDPAFHDGLILVITHIDDIRNQFDTRIDVVKTESGSRYSLAN